MTKINHFFARILNSYVMLAVLSLIWLIFRSGPKPDRIAYPCQQTAARNVKLFLLSSPLLFSHKLMHLIKKKISIKIIIRNSVIAGIALLSVFSAAHLYDSFRQNRVIERDRIIRKGPFGKPLAITGGITFATGSHAFALESPHRVVSVHDSNATNWDFQCTSTGSCPAYYGDYVDQAAVDTMVDKGLMELTGTSNITEAWQTLLPAYEPGQKIAIKVNFNDSILGGGGTGYVDSDAYVDALPQMINSLVRGLKNIGVQEEHISVFDASRYITDRFRNLILYPGIKYYDGFGNGSDVQKTGFTSTDPTAEIDFSASGFSGSNKVTDILVESDYFINIPIMKRHGGAGITLSLKNNFGTIDLSNSTQKHALHDYFFLYGVNYSSTANPLIDINNNTHIKDKTILVLGDGLYGTWPDNNQPPRRWASFNNDSPNILFFSVDPIAVDSVMYDYMTREGSIDASAEDILIAAAQAGLGVHERWNNSFDREYTSIDYIEIDYDTGLCKGCKSPDSDGDGILDDGDNSGTAGDAPCTGGNTVNCDDNCVDTANSTQADADSDGTGDACEQNISPFAEPGGIYSPEEGEEVTLDGSGSYDLDGTITLYEWDIDNDGTYDYSSSSPTLTHTYSQDGTYTIKLRVTDNIGDTGEGVTTAAVSDTSPLVDFEADVTSGASPLTVCFTNKTTGNDQPISYSWDFDLDGQEDSTDTSPCYTYMVPGTYTVQLSAEDSDGSTGTFSSTGFVVTECPLPIKIDGAEPSYYSSLQDAYTEAGNGEIVYMRAVTFAEDLTIDSAKSIRFAGGYDCNYSTSNGKTILNGIMSVEQGAIGISNILFQ